MSTITLHSPLKVLDPPKKKGFFRRHLALVILCAASVACVLTVYFGSYSPAVSEWLSTRLCSWVRIGLGAISSVFPFCVSELLLVLLALFAAAYPLLCLIGIVRAAKKKKPSPRLRRLLLTPLALLLCACLLFSLTLAPCYHRPSLSGRMKLDSPVTEERLFAALEHLVKDVNEQIPHLQFNAKGQAMSPRSFSQTAHTVNDLYDDFSRSHDFLQPVGFAAKPVLLSPAMTYTHISGIYTFFTGESAVNTHYPEYLLPFTIAHEYAHQRGIAPENEANFLAFAVLMSSDDPYFRYSGVANVFSSVANQAYATNEDRYFEIISQLSPALGDEYDAYREFFKPYEHSEAGKLAEAVNDGYLKANGQSQGTVTYSLITTMVVNYCCDVLE